MIGSTRTSSVVSGAAAVALWPVALSELAPAHGPGQPSPVKEYFDEHRGPP